MSTFTKRRRERQEAQSVDAANQSRMWEGYFAAREQAIRQCAMVLMMRVLIRFRDKMESKP